MSFVILFILLKCLEIVSLYELKKNVPTLCSIKLLAGKSCYNAEVYDDISSIEDRAAPMQNDSIFFIDTSCNGELTPRQACFIESAARSNPDVQVNILFVAPVTTRSLIESPSWEILKYKNINPYRLNLTTYFTDTPLTVLLKDRRRCLYHRLSDILRFVTLYKYGGIYVDMHVLVIKPFESVRAAANWAGQIDEHTNKGAEVGAEVLQLSDDELGRAISRDVLRYYISSIREEKPWLEPSHVLTDTIRRLCNATTFQDMTFEACKGFYLYEPRVFYRVQSEIWDEFIYNFNGEVPADPVAMYIGNYKPSVGRDDSNINSRMMAVVCPRIYNITIERMNERI